MSAGVAPADFAKSALRAAPDEVRSPVGCDKLRYRRANLLRMLREEVVVPGVRDDPQGRPGETANELLAHRGGNDLVIVAVHERGGPPDRRTLARAVEAAPGGGARGQPRKVDRGDIR